jgi:hypothetical protein
MCSESISENVVNRYVEMIERGTGGTMTFDEIKERFAGAGTGTDAFRGLYNETFELMNADKENAAVYF